MINDSLRRAGFFAVDFLKGGPIKKHYKDIEFKMKSSNYEVENSLKKVLHYAKEKVPFYYDIKGEEISEFPIINKKIIMENYQDFQSKEFINTKLHTQSTSGSTGTPFKAYQDSDKRSRTIADLLYIHKSNGWNLGERYVYLRAWTPSYKVSKAKLYLQNFIIADVIGFDEQSKEKLRLTLKKDKKIKVLMGYASALESFAEYLESKDDKSEMFNIKVIFTGADNLSSSAKSKLTKLFNCPVINRYSNQELGVLAATSTNSEDFNLNIASYYFEILKLDSDEPASSGELGRIVVTDLYNKAMPFIRYDTGDLAISSEMDGDIIKKISSLEGRIADVIMDSKGNLVSAAMLNNFMDKYYRLKQYQLIQTNKNKYTFKVVCKQSDYQINELIELCESILGKGIDVEIKYVSQIPTEHTGKYKTIINKYKSFNLEESRTQVNVESLNESAF